MNGSINLPALGSWQLKFIQWGGFLFESWSNICILLKRTPYTLKDIHQSAPGHHTLVFPHKVPVTTAISKGWFVEKEVAWKLELGFTAWSVLCPGCALSILYWKYLFLPLYRAEHQRKSHQNCSEQQHQKTLEIISGKTQKQIKVWVCYPAVLYRQRILLD